MNSNSKIKELDNLASEIKELKRLGKEIVHSHGVFDLLHLGHIRHFEEAKRICYPKYPRTNLLGLLGLSKARITRLPEKVASFLRTNRPHLKPQSPPRQRFVEMRGGSDLC